jgi:large subunit ribosomal protein L21
MYAIVRTGGKQYRVQEGRSVTVERLPAGEGDTVELRDVLLIADEDEVTVGAPTIEGARVVAEVEDQGRAPKITVFKYKAKVRYRRKLGHRQRLTRLAVREILRPGQESKLAKPPRRRRRPAKEAEEAPAAEGEAAEVPPAEAVEAPEAAPKRPARRRAAPKVEDVAKEDLPTFRRRTRAPKAEQAEERPSAGEEPKPPARRTRQPKAEEPSTDEPKTEETE